MATPVFCLFFLSLVIHASFSLTIPLDVIAVKLSDSVRESELDEKNPVALDPRLRPGEEAVQSLTLVDAVPSINSGEGKHDRINKRSIFGTQKKCARDMTEFANRCWTKEEYDRVMKDQ